MAAPERASLVTAPPGAPCRGPGPGPATTADPKPHSAGWYAQLELELVRDGSRTRLGTRRHVGPLRIQRPFYPEGDEQLHLYLLHPPGGLVGGDQLEITVAARAGTRALITTPSAQKIYRTAGPVSEQSVTLQVEDDAALEWLPSETLLFDAAAARLRTRVELGAGARFLGWEIGCFGRPASQRPFDSGSVFQSFEIFRGREPLIVDRLRVRGGSPVLQAAYGHFGLPAYGTLYCVPSRADASASWLSALREALHAQNAVASTLGDAPGDPLVVRARGAHVEQVRDQLTRAWAYLRGVMLERAPTPPRIWAT